MVRLEYSELMQRLTRQDDLEDVGIPTMTAAIELIRQGKKAEAKDMVNCLWAEWTSMIKGLGEANWRLFDNFAQKHGEDELMNALKVAQESNVLQQLELYRILGAEGYAQVMAEIMRGRHSGPDFSGNVNVKDEGDCYVIECDPCGSSGSLMRGDVKGGTPPPTGESHSYGAIAEALPWTWSKKGVARCCVSCCINEIISIEKAGFPCSVFEYPEDPHQPCRMFIYKDPKSIPDSYYDRVGKSKP